MLNWVVGIAVGIVAAVGIVFIVGWTFKSVVPKNLRSTDPNLAQDLDQVATTLLSPVALPMHDHAFDKPR